MTLAEKITEVPELYDKSDESTACLLREIGFLDAPQPLKVEEVEDALSRHPALADRWLERGRDQRLTGGWGIECDHGQYRVQSFSSGRHLLERKNCTLWHNSWCAMSASSAMWWNDIAGGIRFRQLQILGKRAVQQFVIKPCGVISPKTRSPFFAGTHLR